MRYPVLLRTIRPALPEALPSLGINSAWLLFARVAVQAQTVLLTVLVARWLGEAAFGQYTLIVSLVGLGNVVTSFGTDTLLIRQIARAGQANIVEIPAALGLQAGLSTLFVIFIWAWTAFFPPKSAEYLLALRAGSLSLFPLALFSITSAVLRGLERMDLFFAATLGTAAIQIAVVWFLIRSGGSLLELMAALLVVQLFNAFASYWLCKRAALEFSIRRRINLQPLVSLLRAAWPLATLSILGLVYLRLGVFAVSILGTDAQTGQFSAAARVIEALKLGHIAILGALLPALSRLESSTYPARAARNLLQKTALGLLGLGFLSATSLYLFVRPLVSMLYGAGYLAAVPALQVLAWILIPYSVSSTLAVSLVSRKREKFVTAALALSLLITAGLNIWWIPIWGVRGACFAAIAGETLQAGILWWMVRFTS